MGLYDWDGSRLPNYEEQTAVEAVNAEDLETLFYLHNTYRLSKVKHCCPDPCMLGHFIKILNTRGYDFIQYPQI